MPDEFEELRKLWDRLNSGSEGTPSGKRPAELLREADQLNDTAYELFCSAQYASARNIWQKAYNLAKEAKDERMQAEYLEWTGYSLGKMGHYRESLAWLLGVDELYGADKKDRLVGLIDQIILAIGLPLSLNSIQRLIDHCQSIIDQTGLSAYRSSLLLQEAILASHRGDSKMCLSKALEAIAVYDDTAYKIFTLERHYRCLIRALLENGDRAVAERWLIRYESLKTKFEVSKEINTFYFRRRLALQDEDWQTAWRLAQRELQKCRESERHPYGGLYDYVDTGIQCGRTQTVGSALAELLLWHRNSENGHRRYRLRQLAGDYHRAAALASSDMLQRNRHIKMARRFYGYAMLVAEFLDEKLCCDWRKKQIQERIDSINEHE